METEKERTDVTERLFARDESVLSAVEKKYGALMRRIAANLYLERSDAEECENDALLDLWNTVPPNRPESIRSYLCMLMRRRTVDRIRYNASAKRAHAALAEVSEELADGISLEDSVTDGESLSQVIDLFLSRQSPQNREIFIRRYYEFESAASISSDLPLTEGAVRKRLSRMRQELEKILREWGYANG